MISRYGYYLVYWNIVFIAAMTFGYYTWPWCLLVVPVAVFTRIAAMELALRQMAREMEGLFNPPPQDFDAP